MAESYHMVGNFCGSNFSSSNDFVDLYFRGVPTLIT